MKRKILLSALLASTLAITGCQIGEGVQDQSSYSQNKSGLVNAVTAAKWINNWEKNKPSTVSGRLFIMQIGLLGGVEGKRFIKHDDVHVYTFDRTAGCTTTDDTRSDGVSTIPMPIFSGDMRGMDGAFWAYDIDPVNDMLLVLVASDEPKNMALATRFLWTMNYWGMKKDHIAIMNGTAAYMFDPELNPAIKRAGVHSVEEMFVQNDSTYLMAPGGKLFYGDPSTNTPPAERTHADSIKVLTEPTQYSLFASMEDMMDAASGSHAGYIILDGRSAAEYSPSLKEDGSLVKASKTEYKNCGINHDEQCFTAFEGHIKGAANVEYRSVINTEDYTKDINHDGEIDSKDASMAFKSVEKLQEVFAEAGYNTDDTVYTYCRTGTRASLLTYASFELLKYKTSMYDGSWIQWGKMTSAKTDTNGATLLETEKWRTDLAQYTDELTYQPNPLYISPIKKADLNEAAEHTNAVYLEDTAYKAEIQ